MHETIEAGKPCGLAAKVSPELVLVASPSAADEKGADPPLLHLPIPWSDQSCADRSRHHWHSGSASQGRRYRGCPRRSASDPAPQALPDLFEELSRCSRRHDQSRKAQSSYPSCCMLHRPLIVPQNPYLSSVKETPHRVFLHGVSVGTRSVTMRRSRARGSPPARPFRPLRCPTPPPQPASLPQESAYRQGHRSRSSGPLP